MGLSVQAANARKHLHVAILGALAALAIPLAPLWAADDSVANADQPLEEVVVSGKFIKSDASSAMKLDVPVRDIPFTTSAYSDSFMKAIETSAVADLYNYMTGIQRSGNTGMDLSIRGFRAGVNDRNVIMVDGLPGLSTRFGSLPTVGTEHIEVVKGPASVLYGAAQPGGFVNIITKKPQANADNEFTIRGATYEGAGLGLNDKVSYDMALDSTGPVDKDGHFLYRLVLDGVTGDQFRNANKTLYIAPSLTWKISPVTSATLQYVNHYNRTSYDQGLVAPNNDINRVAKITTRYQTPNDWEAEHGRAVSAQIEHTFDNEIKWNFNWRNVHHEDSAFGYDNVAILPNLTQLQMRARKQLNIRSFNFADTTLNIPLRTGPFDHKILVGLNGGREIADLQRLQFLNLPVANALSIYNPNYSVLPSHDAVGVGPGQHTYAISNSSGAYASDLITLTENWKASAAVRYARERQTRLDLFTPGSPVNRSDISKLMPMAGLLYQPDRSWTFYTSYNTGFVPAPATSLDAKGQNNFKPETSKQVEVGVKAELLDGNLTSTLALFDIKKKDALSTYSGVANGCPVAVGTCTRQVGAQESKGIEFGINARVTENWQIEAGWAHINSLITESDVPVQVGLEQPNSPRNSGHVWSRYDFKTGMLAGLGIGAGLTYTSDVNGGASSAALPIVASTATTPNIVRLPSYTLADLGIYYAWQKSDVTFKITNVFDKTYYQSAGFMGSLAVTPGSPRAITLSYRVHF